MPIPFDELLSLESGWHNGAGIAPNKEFWGTTDGHGLGKEKTDSSPDIRVHPCPSVVPPIQAGEEFIDIFGNDTMILVPVDVG